MRCPSHPPSLLPSVHSSAPPLLNSSSPHMIWRTQEFWEGTQPLSLGGTLQPIILRICYAMSGTNCTSAAPRHP
eukprot:2665648-Rhodomonas_salina.1